jgi:adenine-specific DNA-methyltransferase
MAARKKSGGATGAATETPIEALQHKDTRKNIPTREQGEFVSDEEQAPETMLYPRDPTLDPQLVWKGKDEQDKADLAVPVVPIYIQEKIQPKALIEDLRERAAGKKPRNLDLFAAFGGGRDIEEQIEFYQHDDAWSNRMILGDSLVVMTSLAQKEGLKGKVQMVYMDPPYGIKFGSNWQVSTRKREVKDGRVEDLVRQPEQIKAFRDTWELGIHSYLSYMRDRLGAARELLSGSGSVFVQIGDDNVHLVRSLLDEVFGAANRLPTIVFRKTTGAGSQSGYVTGVPQTFDYLLWYAKDIALAKVHRLYLERDVEADENFRFIQGDDGTRRTLNATDSLKDLLKAGANIFRPNPLTSQSGVDKTRYPVDFEGKTYTVTKGVWKTSQIGMRRLARAGRLIGVGNTLCFVRFHRDFTLVPIIDIWDDTRQSGFGDEKTYVVQTASRVIERCMMLTTDPGDMVLDPTCGSGTTAHVAEQWGRRWITIDTSRVALALARTRLVSSRYPYYLMSDSAEGRRKEAELGFACGAAAQPEGDIRDGFVYRRAPHVMLSDIANDEEIDAIDARHEKSLVPLLARLNKLLKKKYQEWEIPRDADPAWPTEAKAAHAEWWQLRRARQREIDASIARRADSEILYDQPYEDPKRIRVSGPFTVESLSPHRMLDATLPVPKSEAADPSSFTTTIIDNIKKAGIQNTVKGERLVFERLALAAGKGWIHADGETTDKSGTIRRVAVSIGPEHGTVSPEQVRGAAKEALKHFDVVVVCGFAFDPMAYDAATEFASAGAHKTITVLLSHMNPDLAMGDELLKKTGAGNLFMVFGEPDIDIKTKDGKVNVEIKGLDVYDPTTGQIRSHTTDDIACWFIDTDYNGESFFVRHAYFTGANDPYEKLKRALKAEIDEATWASLYTTKSRPFDVPKGGMIAVKVINHYGDEVLKVYRVS